MVHQFGIPTLWITAVGLGFHIVPKDRFLALAGGPGRLAGNGACLALDTLVGIEDIGDLPLRWSCVEWIILLATDLPVKSFDHGRNPLKVSVNFKRACNHAVVEYLPARYFFITSFS